MVNVVLVPYGLEDTVAEAEHQYVLDRLFSQIMINAENLIFGQKGLDLAVEFFGRFQIIAKGLLKDDPAPRTALLAGQLGVAKLLDYVAEKCRTGGQIKEVVAVSVMVLVGFAQGGGEPGIDLGILEFAGHVVKAAQYPVSQVGI